MNVLCVIKHSSSTKRGNTDFRRWVWLKRESTFTLKVYKNAELIQRTTFFPFDGTKAITCLYSFIKVATCSKRRKESANRRS